MKTTTTERLTLHIGGDDDDAVEIRLRPFKATKGIYAGAIVAEISDSAKALMQSDREFVRTYGDRNRRRISEDVAIVRAWEVPENRWRVDDDGSRYLELPATPSDEERFMEGFRAAFAIARRQVGQLMALVVADDDELFEIEDSDGEDGVMNYLADQGKLLLRKATIGEAVDIAWAAFEQTRRELEDRGGKLRSLRGLFSTTRSSAPIPQAETGSPEQNGTGLTPETSPNEPLDSSTGSPSTTGGTESAPSDAAGGS
jgi:hypothetical protein